MDKQERLNNLQRQVREYNEVIEQAKYDVDCAIKCEEWSIVEQAAGIVVKSRKALGELDADIIALRAAIDDEAKEDLL